MTDKDNIHPITAARGAADLSFEAVKQITRIVEAMHRNIAARSLPLRLTGTTEMAGIPNLVYNSIQLINGGLRVALDSSLRLLNSAKPRQERERDPAWQALLSALNGVVGDYLASSENPLAIQMQMRWQGQVLPLDSDLLPVLAGRSEQLTSKLLVAVHGLCMNDMQWQQNNHCHPEALAKEFGFTPVYLSYNTGRHISENGAQLNELLAQLVHSWPQPVDEVVIIGHSMGGLVTRSAIAQAEPDSLWRQRLSKVMFLGTPHHGAPLERMGNWLQVAAAISPYSEPLSRLGKLRSAGITDLRHGLLSATDWHGIDRFDYQPVERKAVPLPAGVSCYVAAGTLSKEPCKLGDELLGDGLVPISSAFGDHASAAHSLNVMPAKRWLGYGCGHMQLLSDDGLYRRMQLWMSEPKRQHFNSADMA